MLLVWQLETGLEPHTSKEVGFGTHPIHGAEVHSFSKIKALIEAAVISSWKGDHKLSSTLIGPINLGENTDTIRSKLNRTNRFWPPDRNSMAKTRV